MWTVEEVAAIVCRGVSGHRVTRDDGVITVEYINGQRES